ncbi:ExeM/NucH family extracellular endonuclease [Photobacterium japonica]|uniref:ExeM/NucH family extracellular endonuclease n=1 Tax=Photobacterium japonica TaxID=2910235 RepID=UPI003D0B61F5
MNNKLTLLSAAVATALSAPAMAGINDIIISEYVEGSSYNKAIEITNTGDTNYTFGSDIGLYYYTGSYLNQIQQSDKSSVLEGITVPAQQTVVVIHPDSKQPLIDAIEANGATFVKAGTYDEVRHNGMNFTGDDSVMLAATSNTLDNIHDIVGVGGSDWGKDQTFRRNINAQTPSAGYVSRNWTALDKDTFSGLGSTEFAPEPPPPVIGKPTTVGEIQGEGSRSPLLEDGQYTSKDYYEVTGVVSAVATSFAKGFYLYANDNNERTSDGLFIKTTDSLPENLIGQNVTVTGKVKEDYGLTLVDADNWHVTSEGSAPTAVDLVKIASDGDDFAKTLERYEGMLVNLPADMDPSTPDINEDMRVSRSFSFDFDSFRNNMVLAYKRPNMQPNQEHVAGSQASLDHSAENNNFRLYVETDQKAPNGEIPYYPNFKTDPQNNYIRINDSVVGLEGVVHYSFGNFRLIATNIVDGSNFKHNTDRTDAPTLNDSTDDNAFAVRLATQNVLNYFNSPYGGADNQFGDNRGAESQLEFEQQQAKLVEAIYALDADVIGLMEIENNGFNDIGAISQFVKAINAKYYEEDYSDKDEPESNHNRYAFIGFDSNGDTILDELDSVGGDAITSGLIYRPSKLSLESSRIIEMPRQVAPIITDENGTALVDNKGEVRENGKNYQRNSVAATFKLHNTGKTLTVAVNHFKSKGSTCWEDWQGWQNWDDFDTVKDDVKDADFQGSCEAFRVAAAVELGQQMTKIGGDQVVMGDFNSYGQEDAMLVLTKIPSDLPEGKTIRAARDTFIGHKPQFGASGAEITQSFGFLNAVAMKDAEKKQSSWSYSYNDEIGSLDHVLVTPSLKTKLIDAADWHINAAESSLFDYENSYKDTVWGNNPFYAETPFRSSDHDSAIIALSYEYGETDGKPVVLAAKSGRMEVAYPINLENAKAGDIATIQFSPTPEDMDSVALPQITLEKDGKQTVFFDVNGVDTGRYNVTMALTRPAETKAASTDLADAKVVMTVDVVKRDSLEPEITIPPYDGTGGGGSTGLLGLISLLGLGFMRRLRK